MYLCPSVHPWVCQWGVVRWTGVKWTECFFFFPCCLKGTLLSQTWSLHRWFTSHIHSGLMTEGERLLSFICYISMHAVTWLQQMSRHFSAAKLKAVLTNLTGQRKHSPHGTELNFLFKTNKWSFSYMLSRFWRSFRFTRGDGRFNPNNFTVRIWSVCVSLWTCGRTDMYSLFVSMEDSCR